MRHYHVYIATDSGNHRKAPTSFQIASRVGWQHRKQAVRDAESRESEPHLRMVKACDLPECRIRKPWGQGTMAQPDAKTAPMPKRTADGWVYAIFDGEYVKIGQTVNPSRRLKQLSGPRVSEFLFCEQVDDRRAVESEIHALLAEHSTSVPEWFSAEGYNANRAEIEGIIGADLPDAE